MSGFLLCIKKKSFMARHPGPKVGCCLLKLQIDKDCSPKKAARTRKSGWPNLPRDHLLSTLETLEHQDFLSLDKHCSLSTVLSFTANTVEGSELLLPKT